jgi:GTP-binding protein Era
MINVSFDPDAGTLYWYFTDIETGSSTGEGECNGALLLDADGQVIGVELELDESVTRADLALALAHPEARYDDSAMTLTVVVADEEPAEVQPLHETLILDFDATDRLQGCELVAAREFGLAERLERLEPFRVTLEEEPDAPTIDLDEELEDELEDDDLEDELEEDELEDELEEDELEEPDQRVIIGDMDDSAKDAVSSDQDSETAETEDHTTSPDLPVSPSPRLPVSQGFRSGFVALVGKPNVGKSTLLNALLGQKIAIVSPKPQTTRVAQRGILNLEEAQLIFVDTPGIHDPRTKLGSFMVEQARRSIPDADVVCFVVDLSTPPNRTEQRIGDLARRSRAPRILVLNKLDQRPRGGVNFLDAYRALGPWDMEVAVSALHRKGLETLVDELVRRLPAGPPLYPTDQITDQSEREHAAELVREQVLRFIEQEVPHGVAVEVEEWEEKGSAVYIRMTIYVEKDSQKGILIGAAGAMLKRIGSGARRGIEETIGRQAYLELWVKVRPNWRDDSSSLHWLGYRGGH